MFTERQYQLARDAIWRGAKRRKDGLHDFKSVYSIFVSRVDVYTEEHVPDLSPAAQGMVGIVNAKRIWRENQEFWKDKGLRLQQEIVFASTGVKKPGDPPDKYVEAFAGGDIQTNPPATNEAVEKSPKTYTRHIDQMPSPSIVSEIDRKVDMRKAGARADGGGHQEIRRAADGADKAHCSEEGSRRPVADQLRKECEDMSEQEQIYPPATKELAAERKRLAPKPAEAFKAFSQSVFAEGALPVKTKQLIAVAVAHVTQCPYCIRGHTERRPPAWGDGGGDHGSHLGRRRDACWRRIRTFGVGTGYDRARSGQEKRAFVNARQSGTEGFTVMRIRRKTLLVLASPFVVLFVAAYIQWAVRRPASAAV